MATDERAMIEYRMRLVEKVKAGEMLVEEAQRLARLEAPLKKSEDHEILGNH